MMPDKNDASDNAVDDIVDTAADGVVSTQNSGKTSDRINGETADQNSNESAETAAFQSGDVPNAANQAESALDEAIKAESDDPLDFGDQRMGNTDEPLDEIGALKAQLAEAEGKAAEHWDRVLRLQAEMENQRKRAQNDVSKARKFGLEGFVGDLLPVKDSLEMGLSAAQSEDADLQALVEGAELTLKMLGQVFEKNNVLEVNPVDEKFDPEYHQAMSMQEIEGKAANTVAVVMQKGYTLNDRLVRPALVMVAK